MIAPLPLGTVTAPLVGLPRSTKLCEDIDTPRLASARSAGYRLGGWATQVGRQAGASTVSVGASLRDRVGTAEVRPRQYRSQIGTCLPGHYRNGGARDLLKPGLSNSLGMRLEWTTDRMFSRAQAALAELGRGLRPRVGFFTLL